MAEEKREELRELAAPLERIRWALADEKRLEQKLAELESDERAIYWISPMCAAIGAVPGVAIGAIADHLLHYNELHSFTSICVDGLCSEYVPPDLGWYIVIGGVVGAVVGGICSYLGLKSERLKYHHEKAGIEQRLEELRKEGKE